MVMNGDLKLPCRATMVKVALEDKVRACVRALYLVFVVAAVPW